MPKSKSEGKSAGISRKQYRMVVALLQAYVPAKGKTSSSSKSDKSSSSSGNSKSLDKAEKEKSNITAGAILIDDQGRICLGRHASGKGLAFAGGHLEPSQDQGSTELAALRELQEEMGVVGRNPTKIWSGKLKDGNHADVYLVESWTGEPTSTEELKDVQWYDPEDIPWEKLRECCVEPLKHFITTRLGKTLRGMLSLEKLEKNIIRQRADAVYEITHGDSLTLVGNGLFRKLRQVVKDMSDEDFKDFKLDTYTIHIRKHSNDVYSGRVSDGHKVVYQWTNKSLPQLTAALMSVFEWYTPEDEMELQILDDDDLPDSEVQGGMSRLVEEYRRNNIANIYQEMETIREQIRNGVAVDIQQVESRMMKLFDRLEEVVHDMAQKHNQLSRMTSAEIDELERKLRDLQSRLEDVGSRAPETIEAYTVHRVNPNKLHDEHYLYLPRPQVEISPDGRIRITFGPEWTDMEKENFLRDMRARALKRSRKYGDGEPIS